MMEAFGLEDGQSLLFDTKASLIIIIIVFCLFLNNFAEPLRPRSFLSCIFLNLNNLI